LRRRITAFNEIARTQATERGFPFVDVTAISRASDAGRDWFAADQLHPGPAQHRAFAETIWETVGGEWRSVRGPDA
jgi:lysophospholipase L1-like esterase